MNIDTEPILNVPPSAMHVDEKQKCQVCNALLARVSIDLGLKRIHLCQQHANTLLRTACKLESASMLSALKFMREQICEDEV